MEQKYFDGTKDLLIDEVQDPVDYEPSRIVVIPILYNDDVIILQMGGWSINLYKDGTWIWEATDGG